MNSATLPNLISINQQLASDAQRIGKFLDTLPFHVDELLASAQNQGWPEVRRQSEYLAAAGEACSLEEVTSAAVAIQKAIEKDNFLLARRNVVALVSKCGAAKMPTNKSAAKSFE